ncbi:MAG: signal peptidase II [Elusimicrobia bacterium]|jgi:signal peptidase II|nr:signal peptidase II [Elusimicrobiota bacterium]
MIYYIILSVILVDRLVKFLVLVNMDIYDSVSVFPFLNITYIKNTGIAFSLFTGGNSRLIWINSLVILFMGWILYSGRDEPKILQAAYAFIIGGALSNMWDRIVYSGVIDCFDFKVWPVFNIADSAITIGAVLIAYNLISTFKSKRGGKDAPDTL